MTLFIHPFYGMMYPIMKIIFSGGEMILNILLTLNRFYGINKNNISPIEKMF